MNTNTFKNEFEQSYIFKYIDKNEEIKSAYDFICNGRIRNLEHLYNIMDYLDNLVCDLGLDLKSVD